MKAMFTKKVRVKKGQAHLYGEKTVIDWGKVFWFILFLFIGLGVLGSCSEAAEPAKSSLRHVKGEESVYRYVKGDGSIAALTLSAEKSVTGDRLVVLIATTAEYEAQAVAHAKKLAKWFEDKIDGVSDVPVIIEPNENGVGYIYHISGLRYKDKEFAPEGVMTPQQSVGALENAKLEYQSILALMRKGISPPEPGAEFLEKLDYQIAVSEMRIALLETQRSKALRGADEAFTRAEEAQELLEIVQSK